jgi:hypothetical protein
MKTKQLLSILLSVFILNSCSNDDDSGKVKVHLLKTVEVMYPASSLSNYTLHINYNNDNNIQTVTKTLADNSVYLFTCDYTATKKLSSVTIETPIGEALTIAFQYTPQDILFQIDYTDGGTTTSNEINYNAIENNYSSSNKTWLFDANNNFEGYFFSSEFYHTFEYNNAKGIENLNTYVPMLIYETLYGLGFAIDMNFLSSNQMTNSTFEELGPGGIMLNYSYTNNLNTEGLLGTTITYINEGSNIISSKTYTYETTFQ